MSARDGHGPDGIWRIGRVRLLTVVGLGYLGLVLALTVIKLDPAGSIATRTARA